MKKGPDRKKFSIMVREAREGKKEPDGVAVGEKRKNFERDIVPVMREARRQAIAIETPVVRPELMDEMRLGVYLGTDDSPARKNANKR